MYSLKVYVLKVLSMVCYNSGQAKRFVPKMFKLKGKPRGLPTRVHYPCFLDEDECSQSLLAIAPDWTCRSQKDRSH